MCPFGFRILGVSDLGIGVRMAIFKGHFLAESAYMKLPFWRGSGGKSGPGAF